MYTYKRFRTSKSAVIIILALVVWGILGPTVTPLAEKPGQLTFDVGISLKGDSGKKSFHGTASWSTLGVNFFKPPPGAPDNPTITVGGVLLELQAMSVNVKAREIIGVILQFNGVNDGFGYFTDCDPEIKQWQNIPVVGVDYIEEGNLAAGFTLNLQQPDASAVPVCRHSGQGSKKEGNGCIGTVGVGDPEFNPI